MYLYLSVRSEMISKFPLSPAQKILRLVFFLESGSRPDMTDFILLTQCCLTDIAGAEWATEGVPEESTENETAEETTGETAGESTEETAQEVEVKKSTLKVTTEDGNDAHWKNV